MNLSQRALKTYGKIFFKFKIVFELSTENQKKNSNELRGVNIYQIAMCYVSINLSQRAIQTNGKLFQISVSLFELTTLFKNNSAVGFGHAMLGRHLC